MHGKWPVATSSDVMCHGCGLRLAVDLGNKTTDSATKKNNINFSDVIVILNLPVSLPQHNRKVHQLEHDFAMQTAQTTEVGEIIIESSLYVRVLYIYI